MTDRAAPAVLAEDLRALAEVVPFDAKTTEVLETAADWLDETDPSYAWSARRLAKMLDEVREALRAPTDATHAEVLARIGLLRDGNDCAHTVLRDGAETVYRC